MKNSSKNGMSLVELSFVLVIIGIFFGAVLIGRSILSASRINGQVQQLQQYDTMTANFISKFKSLPGDYSALSTTCGSNVKGNGLLESWNLAQNSMNGDVEQFFYDLANMEEYVHNKKGCAFVTSGCDALSYACRFPKSVLDDKVDVIPISYAATTYISQPGDKPYYVLAKWDLPTTNFRPWIPGDDAIALDNKIDDGLKTTGSVIAGSTADVTSCIASSTVGFDRFSAYGWGNTYFCYTNSANYSSSLNYVIAVRILPGQL